VLGYFRAAADDYAVIFTPNATGACRLVGEAYRFRPLSRLVLTADNHNSVNGLREFARARGAAVRYVPISGADLRICRTGLPRRRSGLFRPRAAVALLTSCGRGRACRREVGHLR
jgi:selenocysteine lyase/cysteine desulfurase